jgi:hypothetical protein
MGQRRGFSLIMKAGFHPSDETLTIQKSKGVTETIFLIHVDYDEVKMLGLVGFIISSATTHVKKFLAGEKNSYVCNFRVFLTSIYCTVIKIIAWEGTRSFQLILCSCPLFERCNWLWA